MGDGGTTGACRTVYESTVIRSWKRLVLVVRQGLRDRGGVFSVVASVDVGAAGEVHVRGEADGDAGCSSFHHFWTIVPCADVVV